MVEQESVPNIDNIAPDPRGVSERLGDLAQSINQENIIYTSLSASGVVVLNENGEVVVDYQNEINQISNIDPEFEDIEQVYSKIENASKKKEEPAKDPFTVSMPVNEFEKELTALLKTLYKEEEFDVVVNSSESVSITILYPEITISNSHGHTHTIKELYVHLMFYLRAVYSSKKRWTLVDICGYRGYLTYGEANVSYYHSHLSTEGGSFCLGTSELAAQKGIIGMNGISKINLETLFILLDSYVMWESLEGGPYRYMDRINEYESDSSIGSIIPSDVINTSLEFIDWIVTNNKEIPIKTNISDLHVSTYMTVSFDVLRVENLVTQFLTSDPSKLEDYVKRAILCTKIFRGVEYIYKTIPIKLKEEDSKEVLINSRDTALIFKKNHVVRKTYKLPPDSENTLENLNNINLAPNPYVLSECLSKINYVWQQLQKQN